MSTLTASFRLLLTVWCPLFHQSSCPCTVQFIFAASESMLYLISLLYVGKKKEMRMLCIKEQNHGGDSCMFLYLEGCFAHFYMCICVHNVFLRTFFFMNLSVHTYAVCTCRQMLWHLFLRTVRVGCVCIWLSAAFFSADVCVCVCRSFLKYTHTETHVSHVLSLSSCIFIFINDLIIWTKCSFCVM